MRNPGEQSEARVQADASKQDLCNGEFRTRESLRGLRGVPALSLYVFAVLIVCGIVGAVNAFAATPADTDTINTGVSTISTANATGISPSSVLIPSSTENVPSSTASTVEKKTVRVGWYEAAGLQDGADVDSLGGYNYEYLQKIAQYENWHYEFQFGTWSDLQQQLIDGKIDIIGDVAKTDARMLKYDFCDYPNGYSRMLMACRSDDERFFYDDYAAFDGITVATVQSEFRMSLLNREAAKHGFAVNYRVYDTEDEMFAALHSGEADVAIFSNVTKFTDYKVVAEWEPNPYYFVVSKSSPDILAELNDAMTQIQTNDIFIQERLFKKYFEDSNVSSIVALSAGEKAYLSRNNHVRVLVCENQKPISHVTGGSVDGIAPDYLRLLATKTGLNLDFVVCDNYEDMIDRFKAGEGDVCAQLPDDFSLGQSISASLTQSYTDLATGLIYPSDQKGVISTIAIEQGESYLANPLEQSGFNIVEYDDASACLDAVVDGKADAAAMESIIYDQLSYHVKYRDLVFHYQSNLNSSLCVGVSNQADSHLYTILEKAAGAVSDTAVQNIVVSNSDVKIEYTMQDFAMNSMPAILVVIALLLVLALLMLLYFRQQTYNRKLQKAKLDADRANEAKSDFLSSVSHDIRTPLNGIVGFTDLAKRTDDPAKQSDYLDKIESSGMLLLDLVNDTLELSRIESGKMTIDPEVINTRECAQAVVTVLRPSAESKQLHLVADPDDFVERVVWTDRLMLQKVFLNLLSNAIKYTPEGGTVWASSFTLDPPLDGRNHRIIVKDTGIGMDPSFLQHLFEPFWQEKREGVNKASGTGLGLAIVKRIVDLLDGAISVESRPGEGSCFTVDLMLPDAAGAEEFEARKHESHSTLAGKRILLCEDNDLNAEIAKILLEEKSMQVDIAADGRQGLALFETSALGSYDAILMDLRMPEMDGFETTRAIRKLKRTDADLPIIAMTADAFHEEIHKATDAGMDGYLTKPVNPDQLYRELLKHFR